MPMKALRKCYFLAVMSSAKPRMQIEAENIKVKRALHSPRPKARFVFISLRKS
jgi:hypothetical protein